MITRSAADDYAYRGKRAEVGSYGVCAVTTIETHSLTQLSYTLLQFDAIDYTLSSPHDAQRLSYRVRYEHINCYTVAAKTYCHFKHTPGVKPFGTCRKGSWCLTAIDKT